MASTPQRRQWQDCRQWIDVVTERYDMNLQESNVLYDTLPQKSPRYGKYLTQIDKDLGRTLLPDEKPLGEAEAVIRRILQGVSSVHPAVGYVQGMNHVAVSLWHCVRQDEVAFHTDCSIALRVTWPCRTRLTIQSTSCSTCSQQCASRWFPHTTLPTSQGPRHHCVALQDLAHSQHCLTACCRPPRRHP